MNTLITFSGAKYDDTTLRIVVDAPRFGADRVLVYDDVWLEAHPFRQTNRALFDHPGAALHKHSTRVGRQGANCWYAFKPLVMIDALDRSKDGDVVLFLDADSYPVSDFSIVFDIARRDGAMFFAAQGHSNHRWNKADCLIVMGQDEDRYRMAQAGCARFIAVKKGPWKPLQLLWEWLTYAVNLTSTTFDPSRYGAEHPEFIEHRTEQAILTNLALKHGYKLWRECDDSGEGYDVDRDVMPQALFQQIRQGDCPNGVGSQFRNVPLGDVK